MFKILLSITMLMFSIYATDKIINMDTAEIAGISMKAVDSKSVSSKGGRFTDRISNKNKK